MSGSVSLINGHIDPDKSRTTDKELIKAEEILGFFDFFNQRAGRELWSDKPREIQDEDIAIFTHKVKFLRDFINRQQAEHDETKNNYRETLTKQVELCDVIEKQQAEIERLQKENNQFADIGKMYSEIRAEAIKEFAGKIADVFCSHDKGDAYVREVVYNLVKETAGEDK